MKVNNPQLKNGVYKIGNYNNIPVYYSSTQDPNNILIGNKGGKKSFYITGLPNINQVKKHIVSYESK